MKANELMIGDWVMPDQCRVPTAYTSVAMILNNEVHMNEAERPFSLDEIHGVLLDPQMLVNNGFHLPEYSTEDEWLYETPADDGFGITEEVRLQFDEDKGFWLGYFFGPHGELEECRFHYVHELQHILRVMGIDKEIKL